jgi:putative peptidoglycan lipid II flippase
MGMFRRLTALFKAGPAGVKQASLLLVITALLSNVLGLFRNVVFYWLIDRSQLDIYYASFRIPDFLFNVLIFGAISSAFVPLISKMLTQDKTEEARTFSDQTFTWLTIVFGSLALVLAIFMRPLMSLVVHGFDPARFATAVTLSRILMLQSIFFAWSFTCGGYLNSFRRFASPALAPLFYNIAIIAGAFVAAKTGITAIVYAVIVGAFLHFAVQYLEMRRSGYSPKWDTRISPEVKELIKLMLPRSLSQGMSQFVLIVFTSLASSLAAGSIAILSGMNDLQTTPTVILVNSLAVAIFPTLAAHVATGNWEDINRLLQKAFRTVLFTLIPTLILAFVLRAQIVRLYFSIGHHANWDATNLAIATFVGYLVGVIPTAFVVLLSRMFYALRDTRTPMILSIIAGVFGISWAVVSINVFHGNVASLALSDSIVSVVQSILYLTMIKRRKDVRLGLLPIMPRLFQYLVCGLLSGLGAWATLRIMDWIYNTSNILGTQRVSGLFLQLVIAGAVGLAIFLGYSKVVLQEELQWIKSRRFTSNQ